MIKTRQAEVSIWIINYLACQLVFSMGKVASCIIRALKFLNSHVIAPFEVVPAELSLVVLLGSVPAVISLAVRC